MINLLKRKFPQLFIGFYCFMGALLVCSLVVPGSGIQASLNANFVNTGAPAVTVGAKAVNLLAMDVTIPDGTNGGAADSLIYDKGAVAYNGDPLVSMTVNDYYLDNNYSATLESTETIWSDNGNAKLEAGEIAASGTADLTAFKATGMGQEFVIDDTLTNQNIGAVPAGYGNAQYDAGEAIWRDIDGDGTLGPADALIKDGLAGVMNFRSWEAANPINTCRTITGGCYSVSDVADIYWCDGNTALAMPPNGVYNPGEVIWVDLTTSISLGEADLGDIYLTDPFIMPGFYPSPSNSCGTSGGIPTSFGLMPPQPVIYLDAYKGGFNTYFGLPAPNLMLPLNNTAQVIVYLNSPIADGSPLTKANFAGIAPAAGTAAPMMGTSVFAPAWPPGAIDYNRMSATQGGNLRFIGTTNGPDIYAGWEAIVNDSLGGGLGVLTNADFLIGDTSPLRTPGPGQLAQPLGSYSHSGSGTYDSSENIYDESTGTNANLLDWQPDSLKAITLTNVGSAVNATDLINVRVWAEGVINGWDGGADETLLGTASWDGNSWVLDLSASPRAISAGGLRIFVTADIAATPTNGRTIQMQIPQLADAGTVGSFNAGDEGVFVASNNDGPTDAAVVNPNVQTIDTTRPNLIGLSATDYIISEVDVGSSWTISFIFDKQMAPTLTGFSGSTAPDDLITSTALSSLTGWGWSAGDTQLNLTYTIQDGDEELLMTILSLSGLADTLSNAMNPFNGTIPVWPAYQNLLVDTKGPSTTGIIPTTGAVGVAAGDAIVISFNDAMNPGSLTYTSVPNLAWWGESWDTTKKIVTLTHPNFMPYTSYTFTLMGANDDVGNWLIAGPNDTTTFTTGVFSIGGGGGGGMTVPAQDETPSQPAPEGEGDAELTLPAGVEIGMAIKLADSKTVYLVGADKKRHPFPNEKTYFSWFADFSKVTVVSASTMSAIPMGANVVIREGTYLVKITTVDKVYAVEPDGVIRWLESEVLAKQLYGNNWAQRVVDVADVFFTDYSEGSAVTTAIHPTGVLIQYSGETDVYYIDSGMKKQVTEDVFANNLYQDKFIITGVSTSISYVSGGLMMPLELKDILPM